MMRRVTLALLVLILSLPLVGCWHRRGLCRDKDTCNAQYTPINDCDR